jgi:hypothetical protein
VKNERLGGVYVEGASGKFREPGKNWVDAFERYKDGSDEDIKKFLDWYSKRWAPDLLMLATDFREIYGFLTKETYQNDLQMPLAYFHHNLAEFTKKMNKGLATKKEVVFTKQEIRIYHDVYSKYIKNIAIYSEESIFNTLKLAKEGNIAVIIGQGHFHDVKNFDKEGRLDKLHEKYNLVYVLPHGTREIAREDFSKKLKKLEFLRDHMKKNNLDSIKVNVEPEKK